MLMLVNINVSLKHIISIGTTFLSVYFFTLHQAVGHLELAY